MSKQSLEKTPTANNSDLIKAQEVPANLEIIKKNIADIKKSVDQVKLDKESLEKEKANLAKEVLAQKETDLNNKTLEIETKKKETLDLITKVKINAKLVALDQEVSQEVDEDEKYLQTLDVNAPSFWEKIKAVPGKIWDRSKENPKTAVAVTLGGILAVWGISKLFKKKEKKESDSDDKKEEKTPFWKKALTRLGIGAAGTWLGRGLLTGKWDLFGWNPFSDKKPDGPETTPGANLDSSIEAYESLSEDKKASYESLATNINTYYGNAMGDQAGVAGVEEQLGDSDFEKKDGKTIAGLIPFVLNNRYATVGAMLEEKAFYYEILGTEGHIVWDKMKGWGVDTLKKFLMPIAGMLDTATLHIIKTSDKVDDILNALKADPKAETVMRTVFSKSMSVISYMESRKRRLDYELARDYLTAHNEDNFNTMDEDDKLEKIADILDDDEWYNKNIKSKSLELTNKSLLESISFLKTKNILDGEIDPLIEEAVADIEDKRKNLLGIEDADDESTIQLLKSELKEGKLSPKGKEKLTNLCNTLEYDIDNFGKSSWYNQYMPVLEMFNIDEDTLKKIQSTGDYDALVKPYKEAIQSILKKSNDGTLTTSDLDNLEFQVNDYYKFQKSLVTTQLNLSESRDQNGNVILRWTATTIATGQNFVKGIQVAMKGDVWDKMKGGAMVVGAAASIDLLSYPIRAARATLNGKVAKSPTIKLLWNVGKYSLKGTAWAVEKTTGKVLRSRLPYGWGARWFDEHSLRVAVCRGDLDLDRAAKVANRKEWKIASSGNSKVISSAEDYLQSLFPGKTAAEYTDATNLLKKYKSNPAVYEDIFKGTYDNKKFFRPKDWFKMDNKKMIFDLDIKALQRLKDIDHHIEGFINPTEKTIFRSMMKSAKNLDQAESLVTMTIEPQYLKLFETGTDGMVSAEKFGKYLAKYSGKIDANEMKAFQKFLLDSKAKRGSNPDLFLRNALKNFDHLKTNKFAVSEVEVLKLNESKWYRISETTKSNVRKMASKIKSSLKDPKLKPFWKGMNKQVVALEEYEKTITPEGMKAMKDMQWLDNVSGFSKLSEDGMQAMSKISYVLRDATRGPVLLKALQSAKNVDEVKAALAAEHGIDIAKIDDTILAKLASTKNVGKIKDIVNYGAEFKAIKGFNKLVANPAIKSAGKFLGKAFVVADFAFVGYDFYTGLEESHQIKQTNMERGEWREDQAYFDVATGGLGAIAGACMFIPGAGWIAGGAMFGFMAVKEVGDKYYQDIAKFKQNYADFSRKELPAIKQELVSINAWGQGIDRTWIDKMSMFKGMRWAPTLGILGAVGSNSFDEKSKGLKTTTTDAVKALLYVEEMQNYPAAQYDLNSPDVLNNPELKSQVEESKKMVDQQVKKRFEYIQNNYISKNKSIVDVQAHTTNTGIAALDKLLRDSSIYTLAAVDNDCVDKNNIPAYIKQRESELKQKDSATFAKLESLYKTQNTQLFLMYAQLPYYKQQLSQYPTGDAENDVLLKNCDYFMEYMAYKTLGVSPLDFPKVDFDPQSIDYVPIHTLFSTFAITETRYSAAEIGKRTELLTDQQVLVRYGVSTNLGQNILYDIARSLDYTGPNDISQLKIFYNEGSKAIHGIYCTDDGQWRINENNGLDNDFAKDNELNSLDKMQYFYEKVLDASNGGFTGKMIEESGANNKELAKKFSDIANSHLTIRKNKSQVISEIKSYLLQHGSAQDYISIPLEIALKGTKAGISGLSSCVYRIDNGKILYKTTLSGARPGF